MSNAEKPYGPLSDLSLDEKGEEILQKLDRIDHGM
jgi:hypothetical protein